MSKKHLLIPIAIWLAVCVPSLAVVYHIEQTKNEARNKFIGRWNSLYQRGATEHEKLDALTADLDHLKTTSVEDRQKFKMADVLARASDETLSHAAKCFEVIHDRFDKASLEHENDLLKLTEEPIKYADELNELLEREIQELKYTEPPK